MKTGRHSLLFTGIFLKDQIYALIQKENRLLVLISQLHAMNLEEKRCCSLIKGVLAGLKDRGSEIGGMKVL